MPRISVELPSILRTVAGWTRREFPGGTIREVLEGAFAATPALRHHLTQESGELRPHILCILNDATLPRGEALGTPVRAGDAILIHQAISGG